MFRTDKIMHVELILPKDKVEKVTSEFFEKGFCELKEVENDLSDFETEAKELDDLRTQIDGLSNELEEYKPIIQADSMIRSLFAPKAPKKFKVMPNTEEKFIKHLKKRLDTLSPEIMDNINSINDIKEKTQKNKFFISNLRMLPEIKTKVFRPSDNINVFLGLVNTEQFAKVNIKAVHTVERINKTQSLISIFTQNEKTNEINRILHEIGFEKLDIPFEDKHPKEIIQSLKDEDVKLDFKKKELGEALKQSHIEHNEELTILTEEIESYLTKSNAFDKFKTGKSFSVIEAWVPLDKLNDFKKVVAQNLDDYHMKMQEREDAPTLYKNPKLIKPFELITNLYGAPKYGTFDPTPLVAIFFALFFGFMLTDFVYGFVMILLAILVYRGLGRYDQSVRELCIIFMAFGITTMVFGAVFGSYFGDFFQKLGYQVPLLIDSLTDVMLTLSIALGVGALHMGIGLYCGFFENLRNNNIKAAIGNQGVWLTFLVGIGLILLRGVFIYVGLSIIGIAVIMQLIFKFMEGGTIGSVISIFDFFGFIGDLFSYARLMALGIGTAGISLAVNFMALLVVDSVPYVGIVFGIIIFIMGHVFNMAMNGLGSFIHSTRLHFLEFFSKFYEGGGRVYEPFAPKRKYTSVQMKTK